MQFALGFILALAISGAALLARRLTLGGGMAATVVGTLVYGFAGWQAAVILITFFLSSTLLELIVPPDRRPVGRYAKGGRRDAGQVLANGGPMAIFAVLSYYQPAAYWPWICMTGSLAAVTADTWATELGALSTQSPRLITHLRQPVRPGTSGAVSPLGSLAALLGAGVIAGLSAALGPEHQARLILPVLLGGIAGSFIDSLLGATIQAMYRCTAEGVETEQHPVHRCGAPTVHLRGWPWLTNDVVNLICALTGAVVALASASLIGAL